MSLEFLTGRFTQYSGADAIIWQDRHFTYDWLLENIAGWRARLRDFGVYPGAIAVLDAEFSPEAVSVFLALIDMACIVAPLASAAESQKLTLVEIAHGEFCIRLDEADCSSISTLPYAGNHSFYRQLRDAEHPGLVLFTSGSTGEPRAVVHDFSRLLSKFSLKRPARRTLSFLLFDHIGGINTMLHTLANGGCLVTVPNRTPETIVRTLETHDVQLLPTSPTFLNLLMASGALDGHALKALQLITYGTEPMPESVLNAFNERLPDVQFQQTYGLSEIGILRSKSRDSGSLWVRIGGEDVETRVENGLLQIKAQTAMMGYLNAPSPFTADGWFNTEDHVEQNGDYFRILGRNSDVINVGGQKVFPSEVSSIILTLDNVAEALVYGEEGPLGRPIVCASVSLLHPENKKEAALRITKGCADKLAAYKVPMKVTIADGPLHSKRFKVSKRTSPQEATVHRPKIAFVFSGQAPSWPGTGHELLRHNAVFRSKLQECDRLFRQLAEWSVLDEVAGTAEPSLLSHTGVAQPMTFAVQVALIDVLKSESMEPDGVVGHSMGEIAAAYCAGALGLPDAVRVAYHRARLTERVAGLGRMLWVPSPLKTTRELLNGREDQVSIAANNEPGATVVSGSTRAIEDLAEFLRARGIGAYLLPFGHGFHSPLMTPFQTELETALEGISCSHVTVPIVSSLEGDFAAGEKLDQRYWARNMRDTVKFVAAINRLIETGFEVFLEVGPHGLLGKSILQCAEELHRDVTVLHTLWRGENDSSELLKCLATLQSIGAQPHSRDRSSGDGTGESSSKREM